LANSEVILRRRDRIAGIGDHGRPRKQARDVFCVGAFKSKLGKAVLGHLDGRPRLDHAAPQIVALRHREAKIVRHDHHAGVGKHLVEVRDELGFLRSVHLLSPFQPDP
jgi:hypothetical protein